MAFLNHFVILHFLTQKIAKKVHKSQRRILGTKGTGLVIYLAFLAIVAYIYYIILTAFKTYWPYTVAKFISGTQETFI